MRISTYLNIFFKAEADALFLAPSASACISVRMRSTSMLERSGLKKTCERGKGARDGERCVPLPTNLITSSRYFKGFECWVVGDLVMKIDVGMLD